MSTLEQMTNIGKTLADRLRSIGVDSPAQLKQMGSVKAYLKIAAKHSHRRMPVCYNLYSLEGALTNTHWNAIPEARKKMLLKKVGL